MLKILMENEDLDLENDGKIKSLEDSNIGVQIVNHPFSFYLYRSVGFFAFSGNIFPSRCLLAISSLI
jgi:hypothetical protein